jgi:hypothetical protein
MPPPDSLALPPWWPEWRQSTTPEVGIPEAILKWSHLQWNLFYY